MWDELEKDAGNFFQRHRCIVVAVVVALLMFAAGALIGRGTAPVKTVVQEKVRTVTVTQTVEKQQTTDYKVSTENTDLHKHVHKVTTTTKKPDGTETTTTTTDVSSEDDVKKQQQEVKIQYVDRVVEKWQDRIVEKKTTVQTLKRPSWRVAAGVGVSIPTMLGQPELGIPGMRGFVVQAGADRRIVGPLWLGIFANTQGTAGLDLSASW